MEFHDTSSSSSSKLFSQGHRRIEIQPLQPPYRLRRPLSKLSKKPVAPLPSARARVYKVDQKNFRDLVQKLTGSTPMQTHRPHTLAMPPLEINPSSALLSQQSAVPAQANYCAGAETSILMSRETMEDVKVEEGSESNEFLSFLPLNSSPTHDHFRFFPLMSPDEDQFVSLEWEPNYQDMDKTTDVLSCEVLPRSSKLEEEICLPKHKFM